jgi:hypothetical protein
MLFRLFERLTNLFKWVNQLKNMNGKWLIALLPIVVGLLLVPATAEDITVTADVPTYTSVVFNYNTVNFGTVPLGSTDYPAPGTYAGVYNVTVITNVGLNVYASRTNWSPMEGYLTLKFGTSFISGELSPFYTVVLDTSSQLVASVGLGSYTHYHGYWLTVPASTPARSYSTTVTITYTPAA